ncbi:MAG: cadherin-like domain-containing protein [Chloroflexi bacterium]|nr:cadherin-like domain-containing protein [Chloroflexota bacterium]
MNSVDAVSQNPLAKVSLRAAVWLVVAAWLILQIGLPSMQGLAQAPLRLGILGDSGHDEYQGSDNRGGAYHAVTLNWVEQLVKSRGIDVGIWGNYPEPRRTGFAYNWARSGATTASLLAQGQHTGLAAQVAAGQIDIVMISIGSNDFAPYNSNGYEPIYSGSVSGAALTTKINAVISNVTTAVDTIRRARSIPILLITIGDWNNSPLLLNDPRFADPVKRQRVADAIAAANAGLATMARARGVQIIDSQALYTQLVGRVVNGQLIVGGVAIQMFSSGDEPHNGLLGDHIHAGTVLEALIANRLIEAFNNILHTSLTSLSDTEILTNAGLITTPINRSPVAGDDTFSVYRGSSIVITIAQLLRNDIDPDGNRLSVVDGTLPKHGTVIPLADATGGTYTPNPTFVGTDTFTYIVTDGKGGSDTALVTITVR